MRSAPGFQLATVPSSVRPTIASSVNSMMAASWAIACSAETARSEGVPASLRTERLRRGFSPFVMVSPWWPADSPRCGLFAADAYKQAGSRITGERLRPAWIAVSFAAQFTTACLDIVRQNTLRGNAARGGERRRGERAERRARPGYPSLNARLRGLAAHGRPLQAALRRLRRLLAGGGLRRYLSLP